MKRLVTIGAVMTMIGALSSGANATLLFSDLLSWYDDGTVTMIDLTLVLPPTIVLRGPGGVGIHGGGGATPDLLLKIEEDVITFDPVIHPFVPLGVDRYIYTISNVGYDSGNVGYNYVAQFGAPAASPGVGVNGLSGFNIQNIAGIPFFAQGAPLGWVTGGFSGPGNIEWDILPPGMGVGVPLSLDSFTFDVVAGTPHGVLPAWVHSWDGAVPSAQVNIMTGFVTGPVPEPTTLMLLGGGLLGLGASLRWRKKP